MGPLNLTYCRFNNLNKFWGNQIDLNAKKSNIMSDKQKNLKDTSFCQSLTRTDLKKGEQHLTALSGILKDHILPPVHTVQGGKLSVWFYLRSSFGSLTWLIEGPGFTFHWVAGS